MAEKEKGKETPPAEVEAPEVETPTPEEQMETLRTQLTEANTAKEQALALAAEKEKGFKSVQRQLSAKKVIPPSSTPQAQATQELISAIESQVREAGDTMSPTTQAKLNAARQQLATIEQQAAFERQDAVTAGVADDLRNDLIEVGIDPDDSKCDGVWDAIQIAKMSDGNFDSAKKRASRIIKSAKPEEKKEPEPTEEQVQVAARKILEKEGKLKTHDGTPSGGGAKTYKSEEVLKTLDNATMTPQEIHAQVVELEKAAREGRIK